MSPAGETREADTTPSTLSRLHETTYLDRIDPLHEVEWGDALRTRWTDIGGTIHQLVVTPGGGIGHGSFHISSPIDTPPSVLYHPRAIKSVAALVQFHQMSTVQMASMLDIRTRSAFYHLSNLFYAGVLEIATPLWWDSDDDRPSGGTGCLWRIAMSRGDRERWSAWLDGLTDLEHLLVTGGADVTKGTPGQSSGAAARHNLTTAELAVRAMESCPGVLGVWGEPLATANLFRDRVEDDEMSHHVADAVIVSKDGSLVVVETVGSSKMDDPVVAERIRAKAAVWGTIIARSDLDIRLLFLNISRTGSVKRLRWRAMQGVEDTRNYLARTSMMDKVKERVFVADGHEWWPLPSMITKGFTELEAFNPFTNRYTRLVPADTPLAPRSDIVVNTLGSLHTPHWVLRDPEPLALEPVDG